MKRKCIGQVAVDSGQLLIIDPSYVESYWKKESESTSKGIEFWGAGKKGAVERVKQLGYSVEENDQGNCIIYTGNVDDIEKINDSLKEYLMEDFDGNRIVWHGINDGSYQEVCRLTSTEESAGTYQNIIGAAVSTGFGDGLYDVFATYKDFGLAGERITKVEIVFIEGEEN